MSLDWSSRSQNIFFEDVLIIHYLFGGFLSDVGPGVEKSKRIVCRRFDDLLTDCFGCLHDCGPGVEK